VNAKDCPHIFHWHYPSGSAQLGGYRPLILIQPNGVTPRRKGALLAIGTAVASSVGLLVPYIIGSVIESATIPLDGFNTGFFMCGVIMLVGGAIAMAVAHPERDTRRRSRRLQPLTASA